MEVSYSSHNIRLDAKCQQLRIKEGNLAQRTPQTCVAAAPPPRNKGKVFFLLTIHLDDNNTGNNGIYHYGIVKYHNINICRANETNGLRPWLLAKVDFRQMRNPTFRTYPLCRKKMYKKKKKKRNEKSSHSGGIFARKIVPSREAPFNKLTNRQSANPIHAPLRRNVSWSSRAYYK